MLQSARPPRQAWGAAWLLLLEAGEPVGLEEFCELVCGGSSPSQRAACWLELVGPQSWFRLRQNEISARPLADLRTLRRERRRRDLELQREHRWQALLRARQPVRAHELEPEQRQRLEQLALVASERLDASALEPALRQSLTALHLGVDRGDLRHLLADLGQWDRHQLLSLRGTTWSTGFPPELVAEAERLALEADHPQSGDEHRDDLTHLPTVTIDDDDTCDIDDGLALERLDDGRQRIWIHVADPGRLLRVGTPLDLEARRRGSSLYLAGGILPMVPEVLSNGPFSLRQGQRTAAWSLWVDLAEDGAVAGSGIRRSWVRPRYRLSYGDADELIDLAPKEDPDLADLEILLQRRRQWRLQRGALQMDLPEGRIRCRDGQAVLDICDPGPSRQLVAEAMILAGAVVADFGRSHGLALPYRSQLPATLPSASELEALPEGAVRFAAIRRCLSRGLVGIRPAAHFSLGLPAYVQATSPIRRYGDLVVQRQLAAQLEGGTPMAEAELEEQLQTFDSAVREGLGISREDQRHWQQVWFEGQRGGQWRAQFLRWLRPQDRLGLVRVDSLAMDLAAECPAGSEPGEALLLRVHQVDSLRDQLRLICAPS
ncbi:MAG: RNB domain-containing ribonuclease [Cyanobacteriota bacterium]|nr:RNB domain-containing ribonuclease [Cyanobacteriota bacterium]